MVVSSRQSENGLMVFFVQVSTVAEQLLRLLHYCGMPKTDVDFMVGPGTTMGKLLDLSKPRSTLFTGSQRVAERLAVQLKGKVSHQRAYHHSEHLKFILTDNACIFSLDVFEI